MPGSRDAERKKNESVPQSSLKNRKKESGMATVNQGMGERGHGRPPPHPVGFVPIFDCRIEKRELAYCQLDQHQLDQHQLD